MGIVEFFDLRFASKVALKFRDAVDEAAVVNKAAVRSSAASASERGTCDEVDYLPAQL